MSLKILDSRNLYNRFILPLLLSPTEQKTQGECLQHMESILLYRYQEKEEKTPHITSKLLWGKIVEGVNRGGMKIL